MSAVSFLRLPRRAKASRFPSADELSVTDAIRALPDPLRDTGEIPVLADAQRALIEEAAAPPVRDARPSQQDLERVVASLRNLDAPPSARHPFEVPPRPRPRHATAGTRHQPPRPRIRPLPPRLPAAARQPWQDATREIGTVPLPVAGPADPRVQHRAYAAYMRRIDKITGTSEQPVIDGHRSAWTIPAAIDGGE